MSAAFDRKIHETVSNPELQLKIYTATGRLIEGRKSSISSDKLPEYEELRTQANAVKKHTIDTWITISSSSSATWCPTAVRSSTARTAPR